MLVNLRQKNFLVVEGRKLASGGKGQLTAAEWLYLFKQIEDDLAETQLVIFGEFARKIRRINPDLDPEQAAV